MFIANQYFWRQQRTGANMVGEAILSTPIRERCAVVTQRVEVQKTSVRADTSGTVGRAEMKRSKVRWLVTSTSGIGEGDVVWLAKRPKDKFVVEDIQPRYSTIGKLDHLEVDLATWQ